MGDPAGISPELTAKIVALDEARAAARIIVIGDKRIFDQGAAVAGVAPELDVIGAGDPIAATPERPVFIDLEHLDPAAVTRGVASAAGGAFALANYGHALKLVAGGQAQAVCFTPFNKQSMRMALPSYDDEIRFTAGVLGVTTAATEFNVLDRLWNARVTSHVPLSSVAALITIDAVVDALELTATSLRAAGFNPPRIAVAEIGRMVGAEEGCTIRLGDQRPRPLPTFPRDEIVRLFE